MADGFRVDVAALGRAAAGVDGVLDDVNQTKVSDIPAAKPAFGNDHLASVVADFCSRWERGVGNLAKDGREIAARLTLNARLYQKAESDTRDRIINGILSGPGGDPGEH